jgi:outer membrane protein assembly factor BamB
MRRRFLVLALIAYSGPACGADWPQFLGPGGNNVTDARLPASWGPAEKVVWKTLLPGAGASSAITCGDRIFVTAYSGYGVDADKAGGQDDLKHHVVCVDAATGKIAWDKSTKAKLPEQDYTGFMQLHGYASGTPVTDGKAVYVFFGRSGVYAYSLTGDLLWQADVGGKTHGWGSGTSPLLCDDLVIVNASVESGAVVALDKAKGTPVWRVADIKDSWSTPALVKLPSGKQELVVSLHSKVLGIDPQSGEKLWECAGVPDYVCPAVVTKGDVAIVTGGRKPFTMAIRGGGKGDVTSTHKLWEIKKTPKVPSPVWQGDLLYWVSDSGVACCVKAADGTVVYEQRLAGAGRVYASLLAAGDSLYLFSRDKGAMVLKSGSDFQEPTRHDLGDASIFNATPIPHNGRIIVRSDKFLYCLGR